MDKSRSIMLALLPVLWLATSLPVTAAESYDNCTGFVDSLPATITKQGTWCLRKDLATSINSGSAITIAAHNVTLNCNDFKVGGLGAGDNSNAIGIFADDRVNATVRQCNIRGFRYGTSMSGGGHIIEDNRFEQNLNVGIYLMGDNNIVRRNSVLDTGSPTGSEVHGIQASADIVDNTISGFIADPGYAFVRGVTAYGVGSQIKDNRIRGLPLVDAGEIIGIWSWALGQRISGNHISTSTSAFTHRFGIYGMGQTFCDGNTMSNFAAPMINCQNVGGNASH